MTLSLLALLLKSVSNWKARQEDDVRARAVAAENRVAPPREMAPEDFLDIDADWLRATDEDERRAAAEIPEAERVTDPAWLWALSGEWVHVASSNVNAIRYLYDDRTLEVEFFGGGRQAFYQYYDVPPEVAVGMYNTSSPGRYVWRVLRGDGYDYARISALSGTPVSKAPHVIRKKLPGEK